MSEVEGASKFELQSFSDSQIEEVYQRHLTLIDGLENELADVQKTLAKCGEQLHASLLSDSGETYTQITERISDLELTERRVKRQLNDLTQVRTLVVKEWERRKNLANKKDDGFVASCCADVVARLENQLCDITISLCAAYRLSSNATARPESLGGQSLIKRFETNVAIEKEIETRKQALKEDILNAGDTATDS